MSDREHKLAPEAFKAFRASIQEEVERLEEQSETLVKDLGKGQPESSTPRSPFRQILDAVREASSSFESGVHLQDYRSGRRWTMSDQEFKTAREAFQAFRASIQEEVERLEEQSEMLIEDLEEEQPESPTVQSPLKLLIDAVRETSSSFESRVHFEDIGTVRHIGDGVATLTGLPRAHTEDMVVFPTGVRGLVFSLEPQQLDVILLGSDQGIRGGDVVRASGERLRIPVGPNLLGRVVNPLGEPQDGGPVPEPSDLRLLERKAPGITTRTPIKEPLHTGWKVIDALFPIGRGQRELILGDRQTGKTTMAVDAILQQKESNVACVYVAIGQKQSSTLNVIERLRATGALEYTTVVIATPDQPPALRYLAPYAGCAMAEYLMDNERDVLIIYDDLTKHANAYRELSLLLRRPPGREAYPGDVFYLHSRLLERAGKLDQDHGGGSMTALPVIETQRGNLSAYIPTNLISITDGQIVLDADLFNQDIKPAVDVGLSVSRVGGAAQTEAMKAVSGELRLQLSQFEEVARFTRLGTEVDEATRQQIERGTQLQAVLTQPPHEPMALSDQVVLFYAVQQGMMKDLPVQEVSAFEDRLLSFFWSEYEEIMEEIELQKDLSKEMRDRLDEALEEFLRSEAERSAGP